jgi:hypothetical protein
MAKMRKSSKKNILRRIKKSSKKIIPAVESGLKTVGTTAKNVSKKAKPYVEKGISSIYGVLATGFDIGVKGVSKVASNIVSKKTRKHRKTRRH